MGWFDRGLRNARIKGAQTPKKGLPQRKLAPIEEIVEQGLMVADVAVRMTVKNSIIMHALRHKTDYDEERIASLVRETLVLLADERDTDAKHIQSQRKSLQAPHSGRLKHKYAEEDSKTLEHRQTVYEQVALQLRQRATQHDYVRDTAERARAAAWSEIGDSLKQKASHPYYAGGSSEEYQAERQERIDLFIQRDLSQLMSDQKLKSGATKISLKRRAGLRAK